MPIIAVTRLLPGEIHIEGAVTRVFEDGTPTREQTLELRPMPQRQAGVWLYRRS